jgi:hypothetical protein
MEPSPSDLEALFQPSRPAQKNFWHATTKIKAKAIKTALTIIAAAAVRGAWEFNLDRQEWRAIARIGDTKGESAMVPQEALKDASIIKDLGSLACLNLAMAFLENFRCQSLTHRPTATVARRAPPNGHLAELPHRPDRAAVDRRPVSRSNRPRQMAIDPKTRRRAADASIEDETRLAVDNLKAARGEQRAI